MENDELFTDYALQLISSYTKSDVSVLNILIESMKDKDGRQDPLFLPGLILGILHHFESFMLGVAEVLDLDVEELWQQFAMGYAIARPDLVDNPLLNVRLAKENVELMSVEKAKDIINEVLRDNGLNDLFD